MTTSAVFVIEHLEPELPSWAELEYKHIIFQLFAKYGSRVRVAFTHVACGFLYFERMLNEMKAECNGSGNQALFDLIENEYVLLTKQSALEYVQNEYRKNSCVQPANACHVVILDPFAEEDLKPNACVHEHTQASAGQNLTFFVFGGILGDHPMNGRTYNELTKNFLLFQEKNTNAVFSLERFHLGALQMTTDTAVLVTARVFLDAVTLGCLKYVDEPKFRITSAEKIRMNGFRYLEASESLYSDAFSEIRSAALLPKGILSLWKSDFTL